MSGSRPVRGLSPFLIVPGASALGVFLEQVFGAIEVPDARTMDDDGLLLHAEYRIGDAVVLLADRKPGWPIGGAYLQIEVDDVAAVLAAAVEHGAREVTRPTPFFGTTLARIIDPWNTMWWLLQPAEDADDADWAGGDWTDSARADSADSGWAAEATDDLRYIHETLLSGMRALAAAPALPPPEPSRELPTLAGLGRANPTQVGNSPC